MPVRLTGAKLKRLLARNEGGEFGARDQAAIAAAALWGLMASELTQVRVKDVLSADGTLRERWKLPAHIAYNGFERTLFTVHPVLVEKLGRYVAWRSKRSIKTTNLHSYSRLDPDSALFLSDHGEPFHFTSRASKSKKKQKNQQATGMLRYFRKLIENAALQRQAIGDEDEGAMTFKDFRRCFIQELARARLTNRNIMAVTGIRDYATVKQIAKTDPVTVKEAVSGLYTRL